MRKTKIICTIGPSCNDKKIFTEMCKAGLNVARINFSHGDYNEQGPKMDMIREVRKELNLPIAIMLDTKGPEFRIKTFKNGKITIKEGQEFTFTTNDIIGDENRVSVNYKGLAQDLAVNDTILLCNGLIEFTVKQINGNDIKCVAVNGGELADRKSMSFPNKKLNNAYLSEQDKSDLLFGIQHGIDFVAASFSSCKQDMLDMRKFLDDNGGKNIEIIAKIENQHGVDNIDEICEVCDGIMVARGDLGVEIPYIKLPSIQKQLITKCRLLGKRVITATEMLESMINNPRPTRAEISDVANAVYDGTSAVMLSGETAYGKYPVETLKVMSKICEETENNIHYEKRFHNGEFIIKNHADSISHATVGMGIDLHAKALVVTSLSGKTVRMVSRFRPPIDIIGVTTNINSYYKLALSWGVIPMLTESFFSDENLFSGCLEKAKQIMSLSVGDNVIITAGAMSSEQGLTNLIKIERIK